MQNLKRVYQAISKDTVEYKLDKLEENRVISIPL